MYWEDTAPEHMSFTLCWKKMLKKDGWHWKSGRGLVSYVYVRRGAKGPAAGGERDVDYFEGENDAARFLRSLDMDALERESPRLAEWRREAARAAAEADGSEAEAEAEAEAEEPREVELEVAAEAPKEPAGEPEEQAGEPLVPSPQEPAQEPPKEEPAAAAAGSA